MIFNLPSVSNRLVEDPEFVANAVADCGNAERRQRVHVTGGKPPESAVAEARLFFLFEKLRQILSQAGKGKLGFLPKIEGNQAVTEMRPHQKLCREVSDRFGARRRARHRFGVAQVLRHHAIANGQRKRHVPVLTRGEAWHSALRVAQVIDDRRGDRFRSTPGTDVFILASPALIRRRCSFA